MDRVEGLQNRSVQDALLLKMAVEGKDFQTARKEVEAGIPTPAPPGEGMALPAQPQGGSEVSLTMDTVEFSQVQASLETPEGTLTYEAVALKATHLEVHVGASANVQAVPPKDPLLVDLDGNGPQTTGRAGAVAFDLAGDGQVAPTSFVAGGDALLALDRNGNGRIDSGKELFGDQHGAANGFEELAKFDGNLDGRIDGADPVYSRLQLLRADGSTQSLAEAGIQGLTLAHQATDASLANGDAVYAQGKAQDASGHSVGLYAMGLRTFEA